MLSFLLRIMTPIFQRLIALAVRILLGFLLLREMPFAVCCHPSHMRNVFFLVLRGILVGVLLQDLDDLAPTEPRKSVKKDRVPVELGAT